MADLVGTLVANAKTLVASTVGAGWVELPYLWDLSMNNIRTAKQGYGVRPLESNYSDGVTRVYTMDQRLEVILTDTIARGKDDSGITTSITALFNKCDEIFKVMVNSKLSAPSYVLLVHSPSTLQPELLEKERMIVLRLQFVAKYRSSIT